LDVVLADGCSVSTEFLGLMKKVTKSPLVMDVLNIANVQRQLERLADLLNKIQKALGEYLERERSSFPRYTLLTDRCFMLIILLSVMLELTVSYSCRGGGQMMSKEEASNAVTLCAYLFIVLLSRHLNYLDLTSFFQLNIIFAFCFC